MTTPTRDIDESAPRIAGKRELVERLAGGSKPKAQWRIGTEHEKFGFTEGTLRPLPYDGPASIKALLEGIATKFGWEPILEGAYIIGLKKNGASVSLEPGGQFELSGAPVEDIHQTADEIASHMREARAVTGPMGADFLGLGFSPLWSFDETPSMPKGRYGIMKAYMEKVGRLGRQMMYRSCTVQTNLDFGSEADMVKKLRVSLALQPIATALFANSPFAEGRTNGFLSYRSHVWMDTDPDRTGMLPFAFEQGFGFEQYVDFALDVPMYFVRREGKYIDASGLSFRDFMAGKLPVLPGELPAMDDFDDHLSTIFPEVRLKTFLEMRGADSGQEAMLSALSAFWVGVLYDEVALDGAWELVKGWNAAERQSLRSAVPMLGLKAPMAGRTAQDVAKDVLALSAAGLKRRKRLDAKGGDETRYLADLMQIAESGVTAAERLLAAYHGPWKRDLRRAFADVRV
ncbi:MAG: glutamate--cysteine ligase [Alphaproteobacteria bacterium 32-64-14]|nr:MAG: glutamate--cysteine ligase [Alphaproteobacteria bacterium 32-64-14]